MAAESERRESVLNAVPYWEPVEFFRKRCDLIMRITELQVCYRLFSASLTNTPQGLLTTGHYGRHHDPQQRDNNDNI